MVQRAEAGRNPRWQQWYPDFMPNLLATHLESSPYGAPNEETLALFRPLRHGSVIADIGGGEGRYALPFARMRHKVVVSDVDMPHLIRAKKKGKLSGAGRRRRIRSVLADATESFPIQDGSLDAVLNAGFGYLIPPDDLDTLFGKMAKTLKPGGLMVFEFATNRDRRKSAGSPDSLIGANEYNYGHDEGLQVLSSLFEKYGIEGFTAQDKTIHLEQPYYLHNDLIIAHGYKR